MTTIETIQLIALGNARAYADEARGRLESLAGELAEVAENIEAHFPNSARLEILREASDRASDMSHLLESMGWPDWVAIAESPPPVAVTAVPLITRGKNKGKPRKLSPARQRQIELDTVGDYLQAAKDQLEALPEAEDADSAVYALLEGLGEIDLDEISL